MKVTGEGIEKGAIGLAILAGLGLVVWLGKELYSAGSAVQKSLSATSDAIAGALVPDANAKQQTLTGQVMADLKAAGSPPVGSPDYNRIVAADGDSAAVINPTEQ